MQSKILMKECLCKTIEELGFIYDSNSSTYNSSNAKEEILELQYDKESYVCDSIKVINNKETIDFVFLCEDHEWLYLSNTAIQKIEIDTREEELQIKIYTDINDVITILKF